MLVAALMPSRFQAKQRQAPSTRCSSAVRTALPAQLADAPSRSASITPDGRYVAFQSEASNLVPGGVGRHVYLRDTQTGATELVSRASGASGAVGNDPSQSPSISADGRYVAFSSTATNLVGGVPFCTMEPRSLCSLVYVRDVQADTTVLVSRASGADGALPDYVASAPAISGNGRYVAFNSLATNLGADQDYPDEGPYGLINDIYVRDLQTHTTTLVSRATGASGVIGDEHSGPASISADGTRIAFQSRSSNFSAQDVDPVTDVFVRDMAAGTTTLVSRATGVAGAAGDAASEDPQISADGDTVVFESQAKNLSNLDLDLEPDPFIHADVFARRLSTGTTTFVSRATGPNGAAADMGSFAPSVSGDGRRVAFQSTATNLSGEDRDEGDMPGPLWLQADIFVRDLQTATTWLVSRASGAAGTAGDEWSLDPALSADGNRVAFVSRAPALGAADYEDQVFMRDISAGAPPDGDLDGVQDARDNCPGAANTSQANPDGDALGDACDADDDNDALPDESDNCRVHPNPGQADADGDGEGDACDPDTDIDHDGFPDARDMCPTRPGAYFGCPTGDVGPTTAPTVPGLPSTPAQPPARGGAAPARPDLSRVPKRIMIGRSGRLSLSFRSVRGLAGTAQLRSGRAGLGRLARFSVPGSGRVTVRFILPKRARAALRRSGRLNVTLQVTVTDARGGTSKRSRPIRLVAGGAR